MKKFNLQLFADDTAAKTAVQGKQIIYLFRPLKNSAAKDAVAMAFTTENERTKSVDYESTPTKDGSVQTGGTMEHEVTATAILAVGDTMAEELEDALDNHEVVEIWEANLAAPVNEGSDNTKFKGRYMQGYLNEFALATTAEDHAEYSTTFAINGAGAKGEVTVTAEQQAIASYAFKDTQATGA